MSQKRLSMRDVREILRLHAMGLSPRRIARARGVGKTAVYDYLTRARRAGLSWPLPELSDRELEARLYPPKPSPCDGLRRFALPDWSLVDGELRKKGVTLQLLWQEYKADHPGGYQYTQFCEHYRRWKGRADVVMRQRHRAGEKMFVDYAGMTVPIRDPQSGVETPASIFVAVLGASNYTFAWATEGEDLGSWIDAHQRALAFFGGVAEIIVPDNLKSGVERPCRYEPVINRTYEEMASHYGTAVIPARVRKPRDKAKAEVGVQVVERWILAALRNRTFFSLAELNQAIGRLLTRLNDRPFRKLDGSRRSLFETVDRPALRPLPEAPYVFARWKLARMNIDYHVEIEGHYYSAPSRLARRQLEVRYTRNTVECFFNHQRVACHRRSFQRGGFTTDPAHMPESHRRHRQWTPSRIIRWAGKTGPATAELAEQIMLSRPHPEQGFRSCLGIVRLGKSYPPERIEAAARRALHIGAPSYGSVKAILKNGLDRQPLPSAAGIRSRIIHKNIRGSSYYNEKGENETPC